MVNPKRPSVALVCDWLIGTGGAERVVLELHKLYPEAPIYTSQYDKRPSAWHGENWFADADVRTGWLNKLPKSLRKFLPLARAWYFSHLDLSEYDLVISSSGAEAKGVKTSSWALVDSRWAQFKKRVLKASGLSTAYHLPSTKATHIAYVHSPTHYYWVRYDEYLKNPGFGWLDPLARLGLKLLVGPLRRWDYKAAQRPDYIVTNSKHTKEMIKKFYNRAAEVIHPPVDTERFAKKADELRRGFVTAGRQTPYKRIDLVVEAFNQLDLPLLVLGNGPDHKRLERLAGRKITFIKNPSDTDMAHYFKTSLAFILPNLDDFGIVAVEALSAGTPVIAYKAGGALDYVIPAKTGLFFDKQTPASLAKAVKDFSATSFDNDYIQNFSQNFSAQSFRHSLKAFVSKITLE
ncbi:MAG TPA: glycosyltransferase [Candidatus Saccharimonadales bacterium]|nr:glycosyltransferase [Candidatus Saccharimonadales bacterium]